MNDVNKASITSLQPIQSFAFVETRSSRIEPRNPRHKFIGQRMEVAPSVTANMCAQRMTCRFHSTKKMILVNILDHRFCGSSEGTNQSNEFGLIRRNWWVQQLPRRWCGPLSLYWMHSTCTMSQWNELYRRPAPHDRKPTSFNGFERN